MRKLFFVSLVFALGHLISCTTNDEFMEQLEEESSNSKRIPRHTEMQLKGDRVAFDAKDSRATTNEWADQAKIYLQFKVGTRLVDGVATYNESTQKWIAEYYGELTEGVESECTAYYFENAGNATYKNVVLTEHTASYFDTSAAYLFKDNTLTIKIHLIPMTGRIRLKGENGQNYRFSGIKHYDCYNIITNTFTTTEKIHTSAVAEDGYSPYYYGFFPNASNKELYFDDTDNHVTFLKQLGDNAMAVGHSGYLNIPTIDNRNGWTLHQYKEVTASNITFRMVRVLASNDWDYYAQYPHFYIGETEVTQALWKAIMGSTNNPSNFKGDELPVENMTKNDCLAFIEKLNSKTGLNFSLPSFEQWAHAFKGATISQNYTYSGSNSLNDVAWFDGNSENKTHEVKTKLPNEIGLYDMSGNVAEEHSGFSYYSHGGSWSTSSSFCNVNKTWSYSNCSANVGFRLCLNP